MAKKIIKRTNKKTAVKKKKSVVARESVSTKRYWFKAKRYGYGWTPATWEGWFVLGFFLLMLIPAIDAITVANNTTHSVSDFFYAAFFYITFMIVDLAVLIMVCYKTGEKPRWRWGK